MTQPSLIERLRARIRALYLMPDDCLTPMQEANWLSFAIAATQNDEAASQKAGGSVPAMSLNMQYNVAGRLPYKFHPQASHVSPDWRDGWNAALDCVAKHGIPASLGDDTDHKEPK